MRNSTVWRASVGQLEAIEHALRQAHALLHVLGVAPLADVVEEQRQRQQLGRVQLLQDRAEALLARAGRVPQRLDAPDGQQRVLVDGVLVVEVADDAAVNAGELRKDPVEQPAIVHLGQPRVEAGRGIEHAPHQLPVAVGGHEVVGRVALDVLLDAGERLLGHGAAVRRAQCRKSSSQSDGRDAARVEIEEAHAVGGDLEVAADVARRRSSRPAAWRARRTRVSARDDARAWRK